MNELMLVKILLEVNAIPIVPWPYHTFLDES